MDKMAHGKLTAPDFDGPVREPLVPERHAVAACAWVQHRAQRQSQGSRGRPNPKQP